MFAFKMFVGRRGVENMFDVSSVLSYDFLPKRLLMQYHLKKLCNVL